MEQADGTRGAHRPSDARVKDGTELGTANALAVTMINLPISGAKQRICGQFSFNRVTSLRALIIVLTGLFATSAAQAGMIYVDFNNNPQERAQIQKTLAATAPDEPAYLVPHENSQEALKLQQLTAMRDRAWTQYAAQKCAAESACEVAKVQSGTCAKLYEKLTALEKASDAAPKILITADLLKWALIKFERDPLETQGTEPVTLILSGHFGGGVFTGNLGSLSVADIKKVFVKFPRIRNRVQRILLLGCYTNTYTQVTGLWRDAFPNARIIAGTYGQSTRGESPENLSWIDTILTSLPQLDSIQSEDDFTAMTDSLHPYANFATALAVDDFYEKIGAILVQHFSDSAKIAASCLADLQTGGLEFYQGVFSGTRAIPPKTNQSPLRSYYELLRNHESCLSDPTYMKAQPETPSADQVIRLILYPTVESNFRSLHAKDLANFDELLRAAGVSTRMFSTSVNFGDRKALIAWAASLKSELAQANNHAAGNNALNRLEGLLNTLVNLQNGCVPFSWVEPGSREPSTCFHVAGQCF